MSAASKRGKDFEQEIAKILQKKLGARVVRDGRSGAGSHQKMDIQNYYSDIPLAIECKDHETIKVKEFMRQAKNAASAGQVPTLAFRMDGEAYACLPFADLVNFLAEIKQLEAALEDLRNPAPAKPSKKLQRKIKAQEAEKEAEAIVAPAIAKKRSSGARSCPNGHLTDAYGYCQDKKCKYRRGYKAPKSK